MKRTALFLTAAAVCAAADPGQRWWSHVARLSGDDFEGRETGSPGHRKAADYVAGEFRKAGLQPCGDNGYLQSVRLVSRTVAEHVSELELTYKDGTLRPLTLGADAILSTATRKVNAPVVFVGYGLTVPEFGYDDFAGLDVRGKVLMTISGSPSHLPGPIRAHYGSRAEKAKAMAAAGALGAMSISNPKNADVPWSRSVENRLLSTMVPADPALDENARLSFGATLNPEIDWFAGTGHKAADLFAAAATGKALPRFELPFTVRAKGVLREEQVESHNVCGVLPGSKPESIVLTAHLDHLGMKLAGPAGDRIFNGAMDNASGIATLIETAGVLRKGGKLSRSVLFVAVTGEEKGLLGSRHFAGAMPKQAGRAVANINMDMFLPLHAMKALMAIGMDESTLRAPLERVCRKLGIGLQQDNEPQRNRFIRSDQYAFILRGIPALALKVGYAAGSPEEAMQREWTAKRYHAVSDDARQPVDLGAAVLFNRAIAELARAVANDAERPRWNDASFFRRFAAVEPVVSGQ